MIVVVVLVLGFTWYFSEREAHPERLRGAEHEVVQQEEPERERDRELERPKG